MMKLRSVDKLRSAQANVSRRIYVFGGVAIGVALLAFFLLNVVVGDGGDAPPPDSSPGITKPAAEAPSAHSSGGSSPVQLRPGGRDPFQALVVAAPAAGKSEPKATPAPAAEEPAPKPQTLLEVVLVDGGAANVRVADKLHEGVKPGAQLSDGFVLEAIQGECAFLARSPERFRVCEGERFLK